MDGMMHYHMTVLSRVLLVAWASLTFGLCAPVFAQQADPGSAALADMLKALTVVPGGQNAACTGGIDQQVNALTGSPQLTQELYGLAAQIMTELMQSSGGDMNKVLDTLTRAKTDPSGFVNALSPETRDKLKELSEKIAASRR